MCTRPDDCTKIQLISPGAEETTPEEFKTFNKTIKQMKDTNEMGLTYLKLDMSSIRLVAMTDA